MGKAGSPFAHLKMHLQFVVLVLATAPVWAFGMYLALQLQAQGLETALI